MKDSLPHPAGAGREGCLYGCVISAPAARRPGLRSGFQMSAIAIVRAIFSAFSASVPSSQLTIKSAYFS